MARYESLADISDYPLCWPENKPRCAQRLKTTPFRVSPAQTEREIAAEFRAMGIGQWVISQSPAYRRGQRLEDPGVAVWWGRPDLCVLACDQWTDSHQNLRAIGLTLAALRACDRYGAYTVEQALEGARLALPPPASDEIDWPAILEVERGWPLLAIEIIYRGKIEKAHPDRHPVDEREHWTALSAQLNAAWSACKADRA